MVSQIIPKPEKDPRRVPIIGYLADTYSDHAAFTSVCIQVNEMLDEGVEVTEPLIDHLFRHATADWLTTFRLERTEAKQRQQDRTYGPGYTYFIRHGDRIKIGYSTNPKRRALSLSLRETNIIGVVRSHGKFERVCHDMWADIRIDNTEWFHATDELLRWIDGVATKWHYHHRSREITPSIETGYRELWRAMRAP